MQYSKHLPGISELDKIVNPLIESRTLAHDQTLLRKLFVNYNILDYYYYFLVNNTIPQDNTYHNNQHSFNVSLNCYEGGCLHNVSNSEIKCLLIGGLFHDFYHTQGRHTDKINIAVAINGFKYAQESIKSKKKLNDEEVLKVISIIKITQFPWKLKKPNTLCEQIIRDADLMMMYEKDDRRKESYLGLLNELAWSDELTIDKFCKLQLTFTSSVKWLTQWGKVKALIHNYPQQVKNLIIQLNGKPVTIIGYR